MPRLITVPVRSALAAVVAAGPSLASATPGRAGPRPGQQAVAVGTGSGAASMGLNASKAAIAVPTSQFGEQFSLATGPILPLDHHPGDATGLAFPGHGQIQAVAEPVRLFGGRARWSCTRPASRGWTAGTGCVTAG